ncbi:unnamed protein product [Ixodes persulcatus]
MHGCSAEACLEAMNLFGSFCRVEMKCCTTFAKGVKATAYRFVHVLLHLPPLGILKLI